MALNLRALVLISSSPHTEDTPSHKIYHYATADAAATVLTDGYFNLAQSKLSVNDEIIATCAVTGVGDRLDLKVVTSTAGANVVTAVNASASGT